MQPAAPPLAHTPPNYAPNEIFKAAWQMYRSVVSAGLMGHAGVAAAAVAAVKETAERAGAPIALLDLGCGDAGDLLAALAAADTASLIARYDGVDASPPALALARSNAAASLPGVSFSFTEGDMLDAVVAAPPASYDVILAMFAVHHLPSTVDGKGALVAAARRALKPGGCLFIGDVFLDPAAPDDTVAAWRRRIDAVIRGGWGEAAGIGDAGADSIAAHATTCDLPAQVAEFKAWGKGSGFDSVKEVAAPDCGIGVRAVVLR